LRWSLWSLTGVLFSPLPEIICAVFGDRSSRFSSLSISACTDGLPFQDHLGDWRLMPPVLFMFTGASGGGIASSAAELDLN